MMNKRAAHRSDEEWHQIILAARASGLSDFEYCRTNGIPNSTFYRALARCSDKYIRTPDQQRGSDASGLTRGR